MLEVARQAVAAQHDERSSPMRWGRIKPDGSPYNGSGGCFYGIQEVMQHAAPYVYSVFHGDGPVLPFEALRNTKALNNALMEYDQPFNVFKGTERTEEWISFLISDASPWKELRPHLAVTDPSFINQAGFIWKDSQNIPKKLWYNFVMGYRLPWEFPKAFGLWRELFHGGMHPALALYISLNFELHPDAENIKGPYNLVYPWSALEETCYEAVGRFVSGRPACTAVTGPVSPNVHPLWQIKEPKATAHADELFSIFNEKEEITLEDIEYGLDSCIFEQAKVINAAEGGTQ